VVNQQDYAKFDLCSVDPRFCLESSNSEIMSTYERRCRERYKARGGYKFKDFCSRGAFIRENYLTEGFADIR
jgi:hypothetical protein